MSPAWLFNLGRARPLGLLKTMMAASPADTPLPIRTGRARLGLVFRLLLWLSLIAPGALRAAPSFWVPTSPDEAGRPAPLPSHSLLDRELARQALILSALHFSGHRPVDEAFDARPSPEAAPPALRIRCQVEQHESAWGVTYILERSGDTSRPVEAGRSLSLRIGAGGAEPERALALARGLAEAMPAEIAPWLARVLPGPAERTEGGEKQPDTSRPDALVSAVDVFSSFERLRFHHALTMREGLAAEPLAGLARDYALLAESSRHTWDAFPLVCSARAWLYSALLTARHPSHASARATRAWVAAIGGLHAVAIREIDASAQEEIKPDWLPLLDSASRYRTAELFAVARSDRRQAPLAALLTLMSLERQRIPNGFLGAHEELRDTVGYNLRPGYAASYLLGVGGLHDTTLHGIELWRAAFLHRVPKIAGLPSALRSRVPSTGNASWFPPLLAERAPGEPAAEMSARIRAFALAARELPDDGYPTWGTLGRILWDTQFALSATRLHFMAVKWSVETGDEIDSAWPAFEGHPLRPVLATFRKTHGESIPAEPFAAVDPRDPVEGMLGYLVWAEKRAPRFAHHDTKAVLEAARAALPADIHSWTRLSDTISAARRAREAPQHLATSPYHPGVLFDAIRARDDWSVYRRIAEERHPDDPYLQWAVAERLAKEQRTAEAIPLFEAARLRLPEATLYFTLADLYLEQGDEKRWLDLRLAYNRLPDAGLRHASNSKAIAEHYIRTRRPALALPHAEAAAQSYAGWALHAAAAANLLAGRPREAETWMLRLVERYGLSLTGRIGWHALSNQGDRDALRRELLADNSSRDTLGRDFVLLDLSAEAVTRHVATYERLRDNYHLLLAALASLESGNPAAARSHLERLVREYPDNRVRNVTRSANRDLAERMLGALASPAELGSFAADARTIVMRRRLEQEANRVYLPDALYFAARFLRLRGNVDSAREFLRSAVTAPDFPDQGRFVYPLLAREFRAVGADMLDRYRPEVPQTAP